MTKTIKTNEAYATLAYRRTILRDVITYLKRQYIGMDGDPKEKLICEEVFQVDSIVPPEEIGYYMEELVEEEAALRLEINKFEFTRRDEADGKAPLPKQRGKKKALKS